MSRVIRLQRDEYQDPVKGFSGQRPYITGFPITHLVIQTGIGHHMSPVLDSRWGDNLCSTEDGDDTATDSGYRVGEGRVDRTQWQAAPNLQKQIRRNIADISTLQNVVQDLCEVL